MGRTKRIGVLTSGGDCAGLNAAIRAVVHRATNTYGWEVYGIHESTMGLLDRPLKAHLLKPEDMDGVVLRMGGTFLSTTNKGDPFAYPMPDGSKLDRSGEIIAGYKELGLDALVAIGGDGSLKILRQLAIQGGWRMVAIPKTIDNDVGLTDMSVGFTTAVNVATEALDRLQPTAASHNRVMILEVMGRDAGHVALTAGIVGGADIILIPEIPYRMASIAAKIKSLVDSGRNFGLAVVAEAVRTEDGQAVTMGHSVGVSETYGGFGHYLAHRITETTKAETRVTVLGHVQRGGIPSQRDRLLATAFGVHAVDLIAEGKFDRMVAWQNREVISVSIADAIAQNRRVDINGSLIRTARGMGICLGD